MNDDGSLYFARETGDDMVDRVAEHVFGLLVTYGLHYAAVPVGGAKVSLLRIHSPMVH